MINRHLCLLALALLALGACAAPSRGDTRVRFQFFGDAEERRIYEEISQSYMDSHPGRVVELTNVPSQGDHIARLSAAFVSGDPPEVFLVNYRRYGEFARAGVLEPLGPRMASGGLGEEQFYPIALDAFRSDGVLHCVPQNISSLVVYYNRTLFEQHGVPLPRPGWSWDEFLIAASNLTIDANGDGQFEIYGLGVEPELVRLAPFIWMAGAELVDDPARPTRFILDDPTTRKAIQTFISLRAKYGVVPTEAELKTEDNETRFRNGRLAMVLHSRRAVPAFRTIEQFAWDVAPLPVGQQAVTVLHSDAYCMTASAKDKEAAWDFIEYAAGPEGQRRAAELGRTVPSLRAVAESPAFLDPARAPASSQVFLDVIPSMRVLPITPGWPAIENAVNQELELAFYANDELGEAAGGPRVVEAEERVRSIEPAAQELISAALDRANEAANEELRRANEP